jgi:hypothetical protein
MIEEAEGFAPATTGPSMKSNIYKEAMGLSDNEK